MSVVLLNEMKFCLLERIGDDGFVGVGEGVGEIVRSISGMVCDSTRLDEESMLYCKKLLNIIWGKKNLKWVSSTAVKIYSLIWQQLN